MSRLNMNGGGFQTSSNLNPWINSDFNWMDFQQFNTEDVTNNFDATSDYSSYFDELEKANETGRTIANIGQTIGDYLKKNQEKNTPLVNPSPKIDISKSSLKDFDKNNFNGVNDFNKRANDRGVIKQQPNVITNPTMFDVGFTPNKTNTFQPKLSGNDINKMIVDLKSVAPINGTINQTNDGITEQVNTQVDQVGPKKGMLNNKYIGLGLQAAQAAGLSTGNETVDSTISSGLNNLSGGINGDSLLDTGIGAVSGMLGLSDNSVVRAGGQLLGSGKSALNSIKTLKALNDAKKAGDTAKLASLGGNMAKASNIANIGGIAAGVLDTAIFGNNIPSEYQGAKGGITQGLDTAYDTIEASVGAVPGIGTLAGAIMAGNKLLGHGVKAIGGGTDGMTTTDAILGSTFLQATPIGMINGFGGKSTSAFTKDTDIFANIGDSYLGSNALADEVEPYAGKKFGLFSRSQRNKWENKIQEMIRQQNILRNISNESERVKTLQQTMTGAEAQSLNNLLNGGYRDITFSKKGGILDSLKGKLDRARIIIETKKTIIIEPTEKEEETKNVIPEGALHANLHHMDLDNVTKKGVPVIDNEGDQQAEIERDEIIFRLEVTKLIEEFKKDGSDEAAIKAGKLLTEEILYNTEDRTGLLEKFKQGGEIQIAQEGTKLNPKSIVDFDSFQKYLKETGRFAPDFDYQGFYDNEELRAKWLEEELSNPGNAHMNDYYKLPQHHTYSKESRGGEDFGGEWLGNDEVGWIFKASPFNMAQHSYEDMKKYWDNNEPEAVLWYGNDFYKAKPKQEIETLEFKQGGSLNVIPDGALHARLHHMDIDNITKKGIPVIDNNEKQQAEIELNEIIFRLEVTKKLEDLKRKHGDYEYSKKEKEEVELEAGKLLVDEILYNTDDRTGLIKTI